tara:strand:- start:143 stop:1216 length:1074 start_codon:yes stop_codon:yes gene_type:complete
MRQSFVVGIFVIGWGAFLATPTYSQGVTAFVVPDDQPTIQAAINAANPGTTIIIRTGTYRESIKILKDNIRLVGAEEPGTVIIDGKELVDVPGIHLLNASRVEIRGLVVQNFDGFVGPESDDYHAGILIEGGRANSIRHNKLRLNGSNLVLDRSDNNQIHGNTVALAKHAGILLRNGSDGNILKSNTGYDNDHRPLTLPLDELPGCGILITGGSKGNSVKDNEFFRNGRGIMLENGASDNQIIGNMLHDNAKFGIAIFAGDTDNNTINNVLTNNVAINNAFRLLTSAEGALIGEAGFEEGADLFDELGDNSRLLFDSTQALPNKWEDNISEANNVGGVAIKCSTKAHCHRHDRIPVR